MVVLRCTRKLRDRLGTPMSVAGRSTTLLGDWYATILFTRPQQVVLLVNEVTRFPVVLSARELATLPTRVLQALGRLLADLGIDAHVIARGRQAMQDLVFGPTVSRSVLGTISDFGVPHRMRARRAASTDVPRRESRVG
jgi:hypothetical protein